MSGVVTQLASIGRQGKFQVVYIVHKLYFFNHRKSIYQC